MTFDLISVLESKTELMTVDEVASIFSISKGTVNRMIRTRKIPSFLIGGNRKFDPAQLIRWVVKKNPKIMDGRGNQGRSETAIEAGHPLSKEKAPAPQKSKGKSFVFR